MSKLVILFAVFCAVFGAEKEDEMKSIEIGVKDPIVPSPAITPYSAFPYGNQGFTGYHPYHQGLAGFNPYHQGLAGFNPYHQGQAGFNPYHQGLAGFPYAQTPYYSAPAIGKSAYPYQPAPVVGAPLQKSAIGVPPPVGTPYSAAFYGASPFGYPTDIQQSKYFPQIYQ